jgi:tetratricopeptide (TPR) repeat protein
MGSRILCFAVAGAIALFAPAFAQLAPGQTSKIADTRSGLTNQPPLPVLTPAQRGDIFMARKMYREAIDMYRQTDVTSPITLNKIGIGYHQMLELDLAKKHYEQAIKLKKDYAEAVNNLGTVWYAKKKYRKAIGQYKKALKLNPSSASIYSNLGTAYFARKNYKAAAEAWNTALSLDPEVFEHKGSAGVLLQERTVEERAKFHYYLARVYAKSGANERALLYLRKALEEGLKERDKLPDVPEFALLRDTPEFQELLAYKPRVL